MLHLILLGKLELEKDCYQPISLNPLPFFSFPFSLFPIKSLEQANNSQIPRLAFTANGKRKFEPRDQVFHLLVV